MPKKEVTSDNITLNNNAHQNPSTTKPGTILPAKIIIIALITNRNNPNVITVTGIVKINKIGRTNPFSRASTTATINEVNKSSYMHTWYNIGGNNNTNGADDDFKKESHPFLHSNEFY